jgi:hypothetical protein
LLPLRLSQPQAGAFLFHKSKLFRLEPFGLRNVVVEANQTILNNLYSLDSGREVRLEECHIERSGLGWIEGSKHFIRAEVIKTLPKRIRKQFPSDYYGLLVKPIPNGDLPLYTFMVSLHSHETIPRMTFQVSLFFGWEIRLRQTCWS